MFSPNAETVLAPIYVTGHRHPDTDSVASAIGDAERHHSAGELALLAGVANVTVLAGRARLSERRHACEAASGR